MTSRSSWHDGAPVDDDAFDAAAASFLGGGYRVTLPVHPGPFAHAREQARTVLDRLGIVWDEAPWASLGDSDAAEVRGGAAYDVGRRAYGPAWTRVTPLELPSVTTTEAPAVDLPFTWPSDGPLAGLPTISGLDDRLARRQLPDGVVGLWWNHRDELCSSTAGPLLLRLPDGWVRPDDAAAAVPSWCYQRAAERLAAIPVRVTREVLGSAGTLAAVDPLGVWTTLAASRPG
jgi:hypothetical protein